MELNIVYNEDCLETMKRMADKSVDLVLTDPPL
jgi:site-specific DNA-methyltransferase (adenine-specific)/modification methylase